MVTIEMETKKFNAHIKKIVAKSSLSTDKVIRKTAFDLLGHILGKLPGEKTFGLTTRALAKSKDKTITGRHPVKTGRARAAWFASIQGLGGTFDFLAKPTGATGEPIPVQVEKGKKEGAFKDNLKATGGKYVDLINAVHYIMDLEYGSSLQSPAGMVRVSMMKLRGQMPAMLGEEFLKDWNEEGM